MLHIRGSLLFYVLTYVHVSLDKIKEMLTGGSGLERGSDFYFQLKFSIAVLLRMTIIID